MSGTRIPRKLYSQGGSYLVALPKFIVDEWARRQGERIDRITLVLTRGGDVLVLSPEHSQAVE